MNFALVKIIPVLIGTVFSMILGTLWYGPLFGNLWLKLIGKKREEISSSPLDYIGTFIAALVSAFILALVVKNFGIQTFGGGLLTGGLIWIGIGAMGTLTYTIFSGPKIGVWLLFVCYQIVVSALEGGLFAVWK